MNANDSRSSKMAVGKSKRVGKKGNKKKVGDFMLKKEWYDLKPPAYFNNVRAPLLEL